VLETVGMTTLNIALTNPAPGPGGLDLTIAAQGAISAISFDENDPSVTSLDFTIPAGQGAPTVYPVTVYIKDGVDGEDDNVTFILAADSSSSAFPTTWGALPTNVTHALSVTEPGGPVSGTVAFDRASSTVNEPADGETAHHPVYITTTGTLPAGGFNLVVEADTSPTKDSDTSTADADDYVVAQTLASIPINSIGTIGLDFSILADSIPEADEAFVLRLSSNGLPTGGGWDLGATATHTVTISANDSFIGFSDQAPTRLTESSSPYTIPVVLNAPEPLSVTLLVEITGEEYDGAAISDAASDAAAVSQIRYTASDADQDSTSEGHQHTMNLSVNVRADSEAENEETFTITLRPSVPGSVAGFTTELQHSFIVPAHDNTITFDDTSPDTAIEQGEAVTVNLALTNPVPENYAVYITQSGGDTGDLSITPENFVIAKGNDTASFSVTANDDGDDVPETITLELRSVGTLEGWEIPADGSTHTINIADNERTTATIGFRTDKSEFEEPGTGSANHSIALEITNTIGTLVSPDELDVMLTIELGSGVNRGTGGDVSFSELLKVGATHFSNGSINYPVIVFDDADEEEAETVTIRLTQGGLPPGWRLGATTEHVFTIPRNDHPVLPVIGFAEKSAEVREPRDNEPVPAHEVPLALTVAPNTDVIVAFTFTTATGTVRTQGSSIGDYSADATHEITVADGADLESNYLVYVNWDTDREFLESFTITFADEQPGLPPGWNVDAANRSYRVDIPANDNTVEFTLTELEPIRITELDGVMHSVDIDITIDRQLPLGANATVGLVRAAGTATEADYTISGSGYDSGTGILTLPETQSTTTITVTAVGEDGRENEEAFILQLQGLSNADGWVIGGKSDIRFVIVDDTPSVTGTIGFAETDQGGGINLTSVREGDGIRIGVIASAPPDEDIPVTWRVTTGAEDVDPNEGTVTIRATEDSATFDITAVNDNATTDPEADEEITVTLSGELIRGFSFDDDNTHTFTILANEQNRIGFAESGPEVVTEGNEVTLRLQIRNAAGISLANTDITGDIPLTFIYTETDGENGEPDETRDTETGSPDSFTVTSSTVITGGILEVTPPVAIENDEDEEGPETVTITLGAGQGFPGEWRIDNDTYTITIPANDEPPVTQPVGFSVNEVDLYSGEPQDVAINESADTAFPEGVSLVATILDTDYVLFQGRPNTESSLEVTPVSGDTSALLRISASNPGGRTTITLSVAPDVTLPSGWGLDETRSVLTVNTYARTIGFAQSASQARFSEGTVRVRLDIGAPAPADFTATVTTTDAGTITLPAQPMEIAEGARFHEFDVTIVEAARVSRESIVVPLRLERVVDGSDPDSLWNVDVQRDHELTLLPSELVFFDSVIPVGEAREGAGTFPVNLSLTANAPSDFSVNFALADAGTYGSDVSVVAAGASPTFRAGGNRATINLSIADDTIQEGVEEVGLTLSKGTDFPATGWELDTTAYTLRIIDDDGDASGQISFSSGNPAGLAEGVGLIPLRLSLEDGSGGSVRAPTGGIGLSLSSSDPSRVAVPVEWASFTIPATTSGEAVFMVNVLGEDGDTARNDVILTLKKGTDEAGAGFPSGWSFAGGVTELTLNLGILERRHIGFVEPESGDEFFDNFDEEEFRIDFAESSGRVKLPIEASAPAPTGGLPLTVEIVQNEDNVFRFAGEPPGTTQYDFEIPAGQSRYDLEIDIAADSDSDNENGRFRLSLGSSFPTEVYDAIVSRDSIAIRSVDDDKTGFIIFNGRTEFGSLFGDRPVQYFEPYDNEEGAFVDEEFSTLAITRGISMYLTALPPAEHHIEHGLGFWLNTSFSSRGALINNKADFASPDVRLPTRTFVPISKIRIRRNGFFYHLPITVFSELGNVPDAERENFRIEIEGPFPQGFGRNFPYTHIGAIVDRSGGQIRFDENDRLIDGRIRNPSFVEEGVGSLEVSVFATSPIQEVTPLRWRIEKSDNVAPDPHDFSGISGTFDILLGGTNGTFTVSVNDDNIVEEDETYTLILEEGAGFPHVRGRRIDPEKNRYTFTIRDNDSAPVFGFAGPLATTEADEGGNEIAIPFSITKDGRPGNDLIPDGGICLILETSGTALDRDVFHFDTSRTGTTADPAPNCDST
ncbi:MAG: hypothetical protein OXF24_00795, partial [Hyphomicrobiales bacterium]|nr:hypothetical protein [Hyphomicrobiales bacterium]